MGTSLWIVPDEQDTERLKTIMRTRGHERQHFPSSYPAFHPHVTLASFPSTSPPPSIPALRAALTSALGARAIPTPIPIQFQSLAVGTHFFRSVYVAAARTPELRALHRDVHAALGVAPRTPAYPHVSLCYVDDADAGERGRFLAELEARGRVRCDADGDGRRVSLGCGDGEEEEWVWMREFVAREIWVVKCDGPVKDWTVLDKISIV